MKKYSLGIIASLFMIALIRLLNRDFYYDEIYTLVHYVFVPLKQTVWVYKDLNNHVFFSLLCNLHMRLYPAGLGWLMDRPYIIRIPTLLFSGITIYYIYRIGKDFFNERVGLYAVILLVTTLPYYYYVTQIRGYSLSVMLITMLIYSLWSKKLPGLVTLLLTALLIYTMPSNAVFVLILMLIYRSKEMLIGCVVALILYTPLIGGMLNDPQTHASLFNGNAFSAFCEAVNAFIGLRWLLLPIIAWGLFKAWKEHQRIILTCIAMCAVPFMLFFVKGGTIYGRMFLPTLPFFCILGAIGLDNIK